MCSHFVEVWINIRERLACGCVESDNVCYIVGRNIIQVPLNLLREGLGTYTIVYEAPNGTSISCSAVLTAAPM